MSEVPSVMEMFQVSPQVELIYISALLSYHQRLPRTCHLSASWLQYGSVTSSTQDEIHACCLLMFCIGTGFYILGSRFLFVYSLHVTSKAST